jgi:hypothetical protein
MNFNDIFEGETLKLINDTIKAFNDKVTDPNKKVKFVDLGEGNYVSKEKYSDIENKYNTLKADKITLDTENVTLKSSIASKDKEIENLKSESSTFSENTKTKVKNIAINNAISSLGINDKLVEAGIRSALDNDKILIDDDFVVSGLSEQIDQIKTEHKDLFKSGIVKVTTGSEVTSGGGARKYSSIQEIANLTPEQYKADEKNILSQLSTLK